MFPDFCVIFAFHSYLHTHNAISAAGLHQQLTDHSTLCFTARCATNSANLLRLIGEGKLL